MAEETTKQGNEAVEQAAIAYYYLPEENPMEASFPGVPLGPVLQEQYEALPKWIQKSIAHSPMYSADPPQKKKAASPTVAPEPAKGKEK